VPGSGGNETGVVSILDTLNFSVSLGVWRYKGGEKILGEDTYTDCWEKVWEDGPPRTLMDPGEGVINDRCSLLTGRYGSGYRGAFCGRMVPSRTYTYFYLVG